jgi:hypothetical protein
VNIAVERSHRMLLASKLTILILVIHLLFRLRYTQLFHGGDLDRVRWRWEHVIKLIIYAPVVEEIVPWAGEGWSGHYLACTTGKSARSSHRISHLFRTAGSTLQSIISNHKSYLIDANHYDGYQSATYQNFVIN